MVEADTALAAHVLSQQESLMKYIDRVTNTSPASSNTLQSILR